MRAFHKQMQFTGNRRPVTRLRKVYAVLHRHQIIRNRMPQKNRRRVRRNLLFQTRPGKRFRFGILSQQQGKAVPMGLLTAGDHRIAQHHRIRPVGNARKDTRLILLLFVMHRKASHQMPARRKAAAGNPVADHMPFPGMFTDTAHRSGNIRKRLPAHRSNPEHIRSICQNKSLIPCLVKTLRHDLAFRLAHDRIAAAWHHQHRRPVCSILMQIGPDIRPKLPCERILIFSLFP